MKKIKSKLLIFITSLIFVFSLSIASFAADWSFFISDCTPDSGNTLTVVTHHGSGASAYDKLQSTSNGTYCVYYNFPNNNLIAGQTYYISVDGTYGSTTQGYIAFGFDEATAGSNSYFREFDINSAFGSSPSFKNLTFSFTYSGQNRLAIYIANSGTTFVLSLKQFTLTRYNPNAALESQLDEQNSLVNQQIEEQSEHFSQIYEQNSELQSQLFDDGETYSMPEVDLAEYYSYVNDNNIIIDASDTLTNNHIMNGLKAFSTYFELFWDGISTDTMLDWIIHLAYLSLTCTIFVWAVGHIQIGGGKE